MTVVIYICAFLGITACCFTCFMGFVRLLQSLANDGLFPKVFAEVDPKTGIPVKGSVLAVIAVIVVAFF